MSAIFDREWHRLAREETLDRAEARMLAEEKGSGEHGYNPLDEQIENFRAYFAPKDAAKILPFISPPDAA